MRADAPGGCAGLGASLRLLLLQVVVVVVVRLCCESSPPGLARELGPEPGLGLGPPRRQPRPPGLAGCLGQRSG